MAHPGRYLYSCCSYHLCPFAHRQQNPEKRGRGFLASIAFIAATGAVWIIYSYSQQYLTVSTVLIGFLMLFGMIGVAIVVLTEAHEWAEAIWSKGTRRAFTPVQVPDEMLPHGVGACSGIQ